MLREGIKFARSGLTVSLALLALTALVLSVVSYGTPLRLIRTGSVEGKRVVVYIKYGWFRVLSSSPGYARQYADAPLSTASRPRQFRFLCVDYSESLSPIQTRFQLEIDSEKVIDYKGTPTQNAARFTQISVWLPPFSVILAIYPAVCLFRGPVRRRRRRRRGLCVGCGYDLTGNVTGTCPECGSQR